MLTRSSLSTDLDVNIRSRNNDYDVRAAMTGGYEYSFLDSSHNETRLSQFYLDVLDRRKRLSGRVGRQYQSTGGVLGRFDGALLGYQLFPGVKANLVGGLPTESSNVERFRTDRYFYGLSLDLGTFADRLDFNTFILNQMADGIIDRRAVGGEVRYFDTSRSFFSLVDYDIFFDTLNTALLNGNWTFADNTTVNFSADYRKSPILMTSNALQGQTVDSVKDLLKTYSESEVFVLARDRTSIRHSFMVGASHPVNKKFQVSGDFTVAEQSGTVASGGVDKSPGTGYEHFYALQLIGSSLIKEGDIAIAGLRYSDASTSDTVSFDMNTRYPVNNIFRINPRFRTDYSYNTPRKGEVLKMRPSLRIDYYPKKWLKFELEGGGEWLYENYPGQKEESFNYFIVAGYRVDF